MEHLKQKFRKIVEYFFDIIHRAKLEDQLGRRRLLLKIRMLRTKCLRYLMTLLLIDSKG